MDPAALYSAIRAEMSEVLIGKETLTKGITIALLTDGHILLEGVPGVAKTTVANLFAVTTGFEYNRIQMTPDILPADITGTSIYREQTGEFELQMGPVFANVVLADEINRASPKTQAALLEAMEEGQVTVGGETYQLPEPFFVIATQNPVEQEGTFPLPEAQKDRFVVKTSLGFPSLDGELELLDRRADRTSQTPTVSTVCTTEQIRMLRDAPEHVHVESDLRQYIAHLTRATREHEHVKGGVSPRGTQRLFETTRAMACCDGREFATPEDVKAVAQSVLAHRLVLTADARVDTVAKSDVVADILEEVQVPTVDYSEPMSV